MGYTNKTSHYELPQYVANDKPSWLGDFNSAMLKIDTVMADNDATAEAANSAATGAQTQVAALSAQLSTIQGQVNTAVDTATTADGKATTAQSVATQASTTAGEAKTLAETAKQSADLALPIGGGTMTGELILSGAPTQNNGAATKGYVDSKETSVKKFANDPSVSGTFTAILIGNAVMVGGDFTKNSVVANTIATISGNPLRLSTSKHFGSRIRVQSGGEITYTDLIIRYNAESDETQIAATGLAASDTHNIVNRIFVGGV